MKNITSAVLGLSLLIGSAAFAQDKTVATPAPAAPITKADTKTKMKKHNKKAVKPVAPVAPAAAVPPAAK